MTNTLQTCHITNEDKHALAFLKILDPDTDTFCFRTFDDVKIDGSKSRGDLTLLRKIDSSLKDALPELRSLNEKGAGVFVVVNQGGQQKSEIVKVRAVFADTDGAPLEPLLVLKPHMVVESSKDNWHVYWRVNDCPLEQFPEIQTSIAKKFGTDPSVKDLPRVMRLPGFNHNKYDPYLSKIIVYNPELKAYTVDSLREALEISNSDSNIEADIFKDIDSLGYTKKFKLEKLGSTELKAPYPYTPENAFEVFSAAKVVHPNIQSEEEFSQWGLMCANLIKLDGWPEQEVKPIFNAICDLAPNVDKSLNDVKFESYLKQAESYAGEPRRSASLFYLAKEKGWEPIPKITDALTAVQNKYALISLGGKVGIIDKEELEERGADGSANRLVIMNRIDGGLLIQRFLAKRFPQVDAKSILGTFTHHQNTILYNGVEFNPRNTTPNVLNLWKGMTADPLQGEWTLIKSLLLEVLCGGREAEYQYLIKYLAHALQRPWEKPGVMIILLGGQGIGKGTFARILQKIWSATFLQVNRIKQIVGDFNGSLERAYIVFLDEALFAGDKGSSDALKSLVTESTISINEKHQPARQITSYHRFISATNAEHFKATDRDDRRDFVLRVSEHKKGDYAYWNALNEEIHNGGIDAFVYELLAIDLAEFNIRAKPNTRELTDQKLQSLDKFPRWWFDCLSQGLIPNCSSQWPDFISSASLLHLFKESDTSRVYKPIIDRDLANIMSKICPSANREQGMEGQFRRRGYSLPSLNTARGDFERYIGDKVEWEEFDALIEQPCTPMCAKQS